MEPVTTTALLAKAGGAFATVLAKYAAGHLLRAEPVKISIGEVDRAFAGKVENVAQGLQRWLADPEVQAHLTAFQQRPAGHSRSIPVEVIQQFINTGFFAGEETAETARTVLDAFLTRLNENVLRDPQAGPIIADARSDARMNEVMGELHRIGRVMESDAPRQDEHPGRWWEAVRERSNGARALLNPHSLPRIPRLVVESKLYPALKRGLSEERRRIVPILGPAGYGKSTLLGEIYDRLLQDAEVGWVMLLLATELPYAETEHVHAADRLAGDLGSLFTGGGTRLQTLVDGLNADHGAGVLLIDTVDLILNRTFVPAFRTLLQALLASGVTVAFTCRDHEYHVFFEPKPDAFGALAPAVDHYRILEFEDEEVVTAADAFIEEHPEISIPEGEPSFGAALLSLTAGNHSLREIVRNPLRLAMLCELFGRDRNVPADLTTSRLYEIYWERKISRSRKYTFGSAVPARMEKLCLDLARLVFQQSHDVIRESVYLSDAREADNAGSAAASELISEDVLQVLGDGRIRFFHQTFLEYAIARLLATRSGRDDREHLLQQLADPDAEMARLHWWPVFRQLLSIVDEHDFDMLTRRVGLDRLSAFRAAAFAAAARKEADALLSLMPVAQSKGAEFQEDLLDAVLTAPHQIADAAWSVALALVRSAPATTAINAVKACGKMLSRFPDSMAGRISDVFSALNDNASLSHHLRSSAAGFFLTAGRDAIGGSADLQALEVLWEQSPMLGDESTVVVLQLYGHAAIPLTSKEALVQTLVGESAPRKVRQELAKLLGDVAPLWLPPAPGVKWNSWAELLHAPLPEGWDVIQAQVVGHKASTDAELVADLVKDFLHGPSRHLRRNMIALSEAARLGSGPTLIRAVENTVEEPLPPERYRTISRFAVEMAEVLDDEHRLRLAVAVLNLDSTEAEPTIAILATVADLSIEAKERMLKLVESRPSESWETLASLILRRVRPSIRADVAKRLLRLGSGHRKPVSPIILSLLAELARDDPGALDVLLDMVMGKSRKTALAAAALIQDLAGSQARPAPEEVLRLLRSSFPGVQVNGIQALNRILNATGALAEEIVGEAAKALEGSTNPTVLQPFCDLVAEWIRRTRRVPRLAIQSLAYLPDRLPKQPVNAGLARSALVCLKVAAQSEDPIVAPDLSEWALKFFRWIDVQRLGDGEVQMTELLAAVARIDSHFLARLVETAEAQSVRNVRAAALAMRRFGGPHSVHLNHLMRKDWCPEEVRRLVLSFRGA